MQSRVRSDMGHGLRDFQRGPLSTKLFYQIRKYPFSSYLFGRTQLSPMDAVTDIGRFLDPKKLVKLESAFKELRRST